MNDRRANTAAYPLCNELLDRYHPLTPEQQVTATTEERIFSVIAHLVTRAHAFSETLKPTQKANFDIEDLMQELWVELTDKDDRWNPAEGRYITYATMLAEKLFSHVRDKSRTVQSPRNSGSRLKNYNKARAEGSLSARQSGTEQKIKGTKWDRGDLTGYELDGSNSPDQEAADSEKHRAIHSAMVMGISKLTTFEAAALGQRYGLWGQKPKTAQEIADKHKTDLWYTREAIKVARGKIRDVLEAAGHTMTNEEI